MTICSNTISACNGETDRQKACSYIILHIFNWIQLAITATTSYTESKMSLKNESMSRTLRRNHRVSLKKGTGFPYSIPSVGPGVDPSVQAVSLQVTLSHPPGGRLPLLSARPAVTSPAAEHHRPLAGTKLYCLVTRGT